MRFSTLGLLSSLLVAPLPVLAHGEAPTPSHGGIMQEAAEMWLELVVQGTAVSVYVLDESRKPVPASQVTGTATVLVANQMHKVALTPAAGNQLHGMLPVAPPAGKVVATVSLKAGSKTVSARFVPAS